MRRIEHRSGTARLSVTALKRQGATAELTARSLRGDRKTALAAARALVALRAFTAVAKVIAARPEIENPIVDAVAGAALREPCAVEWLMRWCRDGAISAPYGLNWLCKLAMRKKLARDRRSVRMFRDALAVQPTVVQGVIGLVGLRDVASLDSIVALLERDLEPRLNLWYWIAEATVELEGGARELGMLERARSRARSSWGERDAFDRAIRTLRRRVIDWPK